jgi:hypothetical protein
MYYMKIAKTFRLSEEAAAVLEASDNATQLIEGLLLNESKSQNDNLAREVRNLAMLIDGLANDMIRLIQKVDTVKQPVQATQALPIATGDTFVPKPPDPELGYPCCSGRNPCKHWAFDGLDGVWKNTLTGRTKDV